MWRGVKRMKSGLGVFVALAVLVAGSPPAGAAHGSDGDPVSGIPALFSGAYGTIKDHDDITEEAGEDKQPDTACEFGSHGASAYRVGPVDALTKIWIQVTDDLGGDSLECVAVYRKRVGGEDLPALYEYPELDDYLVDVSRGDDDCPSVASVCRISWDLPATDTYYIVFWQDHTDSSTFRFTARVLQNTTTKVKVKKGFFKRKGDKYVVHEGKKVCFKGKVKPAEVGGKAAFKLFKKTDDGKKLKKKKVKSFNDKGKAKWCKRFKKKGKKFKLHVRRQRTSKADRSKSKFVKIKVKA